MHPAARRLLPPLLLCAAVLAAGLTLPSCAGDDPLDREDAPFPDGKADGGIDEGSPEALAVLALVNDPAVGLGELDDDARLNARAARGIIDHRDGADGVAGTADDDLFDDLAELDAVKYVGPVALGDLLDYAAAKGLLDQEAQASVIFSPQPHESSHAARIADLIGQAQHTLDIAMYSFSDAAISDALAAAAARGVKIRFIWQGGNDDRKLTGDALARTTSGRLEQMGINVRYVNKIMHHKMMIVDGPRDDAERAATATLVTGSANWSFGGASIFDENTMFFTGHPALVMKYQNQFDLMWDHSRDVVVDPALPYEVSTADLSADKIPATPGEDVLFTSDNFDIDDGSTTFRVDTSRTRVADRIVQAIAGATRSIHVASGHMRLKPVAEALIAAKQAHPDLDIRVYLDQQEYITALGDQLQQDQVDQCLADATTDTQRFKCENRDVLWGKRLGDAGIEVRYKAYAYRWDFSYAVQMHDKYILIDGDELISGSYNLSMNAEHGTFENTVHLAGPAFADLINHYQDNFDRLWDTGRGPDDDLLPALRGQITAGGAVPLVFPPMALSWQDYTDLRSLIREHCPAVDSSPYRTAPAAHQTCTN